MFDPLIAAFGPNFDFKTGKDRTPACPTQKMQAIEDADMQTGRLGFRFSEDCYATIEFSGGMWIATVAKQGNCTMDICGSELEALRIVLGAFETDPANLEL